MLQTRCFVETDDQPKREPMYPVVRTKMNPYTNFEQYIKLACFQILYYFYTRPHKNGELNLFHKWKNKAKCHGWWKTYI